MTSHSLFTAAFTVSLLLSAIYLMLTEPSEILSFIFTASISILILLAVLYVTRKWWAKARFGD